MRKFNVRWWRDDPDRQRQRYEQMIRQWNGQQYVGNLFLEYLASRIRIPTGFYEVTPPAPPYTYWQIPQETLDQMNSGLSRN